jgi:homeobox protein cut-like
MTTSSQLRADSAELEAALATWSASNFADVVQQMNLSVTQSKQQRDQSVTARKALADTTKQFKRSVKVAEGAAGQLSGMSNSSDDGVITATVTAMDALSKECRVIVKSYQEEIDNLTRRCKATEQGYSTALAALTDLPDPAQVLVSCQEQMQAQGKELARVLQTMESVNKELEKAEKTNAEYKKQIEKGSASSNSMSNKERDELLSLRKEVAEYEVEFRSLKNQDITIRKLEEKIYELQTAGEESLRHAIDEARQELALTEGRRARDVLEREAQMEAKVQTLELQLRSERAGREASQNDMLTADDMVSSKEAAWEAQRQILVHDNERVREALQTVKLERDHLSSKLEAALAAVNPTITTTGSLASRPISAPPSVSGATGAASVHDLMLERNAYEAEVSAQRNARRETKQL